MTFRNSIAELAAVILDQMNKWQLTYSQFNKLGDYKHKIDLHGKLSTKLLVQAANKKTQFMFMIDWPEDQKT